MSELFSTLPRSLRIGVLRGGPSLEYETSLNTGDTVLKTFSETHQPVDIFISTDGEWYMQGVERSPERILKNVDVVWNGLHGEFGEDGAVQDILSSHGVLYTGSDRYSSAISMNRWLAKEKLRTLGIKTPLAILVRREDDISKKTVEIFGSIPRPFVVKPAMGGYAVSFTKPDSLDDLVLALGDVLKEHESALVEEYIAGKHAISGIINGFRGQDMYALSPIEFINTENDFISPGNFSEKEKREIESLARSVHEALGLRHYSSSDFMVTPRRGIYFLEVTTSPKISEASSLGKSLGAVGSSIKEFLHHIVRSVLNRK